jgi:hypothetical protein
MHVFRACVREIDTYLRGRNIRLVNYQKRYWAGLRVGTSVTEGTAKFLVQSPDEQAAADGLVASGWGPREAPVIFSWGPHASFSPTPR